MPVKEIKIPALSDRSRTNPEGITGSRRAIAGLGNAQAATCATASSGHVGQKRVAEFYVMFSVLSRRGKILD